MSNKDSDRTLMGIGPRTLLFSMIFSLPVILFTFLTHPKYVIRSTWKVPFRIAGAILISTGLVFHLLSTKTMLKAYKNNELVTTGTYGICRHPMYSAEMIAILPGVVLFVGMPILLLVPAIIYLTFRFMTMKREEEPLCEIFGDEYLKYRAEVNAILPTLSRIAFR
jgi:protein-S-isoprenylcysteine O-methyltransferase Ste14